MRYFLSALFIVLCLGVGSQLVLAENGTINTIDQFTSTTTPSSAITQRTWGKAIKITGLSTGLCLTLDVNKLLTTTSCGSGGAGSGTVSTSTDLVAGQVDFSTGVNTIGNDSSFLFSTSLKLLTATNASTTALTAVTSYLGTVASGIWNGTNIAVANGGTGLSSFTANSLLYSNNAGNALAFAATSTLNIGGNAATATALAANGANCTIGNYPLGVDASGAVENCTAVAASSAFPFTPDTNFNAITNATGTPVWFKLGLQASSTSKFDALNTIYATSTYASSTALTSTRIFSTNASTTNLIISGITGTQCLHVTTDGTVSGTGSECGSGGGGIGDPFSHPAAGQSATTSLMILSGNASTTQFSALGPIYVGTTSTTTIWGNATSTFNGGISIATGGLTVSTLTSCDTIDTDGSGNFKCGTDATGAGGGSWPFTTTDTNFGVAVQSTTTPIWFKTPVSGTVSLMASSTSYFDAGIFNHATSSISFYAASSTLDKIFSKNASTTFLGLPNITSKLLLTDANGSVGPYGGSANCTNQVINGISAVGAGNCVTVSNAMLANSTISGVALGSNLANLSISGSITGTTYNGSAAVSDWALNMANANAWTAGQTFVNASSTGGFYAASSTLDKWFGTQATTTSFAASSSTIQTLNVQTLNVPSIPSALIKTSAAGVTSAYGGSAPCTNQVALSLSALGVITCTSVTNAMLSNSTISGVALGGTLFAHTVSGSLTGTSYTGTAAVSDWALNMANANSWTAGQTFVNATSTGALYAASSTQDKLFSKNATTTFLGLPNITSNFLYTNSTGSVLGAASSSFFGYTPLNPTRSITVNGTTNQITSSAGAQDLSADRTWTLSLPNNVIFPIAFNSTYGTTTYASSTSMTSTLGSWFATTGGKVGVGSTSPFAKFGVQGIAADGNPIFDVASSSGDSYLRVLSTGTTTIRGPIVGTSTQYMYSTASGKGAAIIMEDEGGGACTQITTKTGTVKAAVVACPTEI